MKPNLKKTGQPRCGCVVLAFLLVLLLTMTPMPARAHKVTVFAWVEGDTVVTQSKFAGGRFAKGARLEIYNSAGEKLLEGLSDDRGQFAFKPPKPEALRIVLKAGSGHRNEWQVAAEEFTVPTTLAPSPAAGGEKKPPSRTAPAADPPADTVTLSTAELQALIEAVMERKLAPVLRRLEQQGQGPSLNDIIGGIGYIIGLVGLGAYIHSRRKTG